MLYILTSVWVLRTPKAGQHSHFQHFFCKKAKQKQEIWHKFLQKTHFLSLHQNAGRPFYSPKNEFFFSKNTFSPIKSCKSHDFVSKYATNIAQTNLYRQTNNASFKIIIIIIYQRIDMERKIITCLPTCVI